MRKFRISVTLSKPGGEGELGYLANRDILSNPLVPLKLTRPSVSKTEGHWFTPVEAGVAMCFLVTREDLLEATVESND